MVRLSIIIVILLILLPFSNMTVMAQESTTGEIGFGDYSEVYGLHDGLKRNATDEPPHWSTSTTKQSTLRSRCLASSGPLFTNRWRPNNKSNPLLPQPTCQRQTQEPRARMRTATNGSPQMTGPISTEPSEAVLNGSSLRIEFMLNQNHGQIGPLGIDERSDCIQY